MINREMNKGGPAKKEADSGQTQTTSSRSWSSSSYKNPRIVRVSRSFGGKDRHSKVCTVRGLRDRRIRLSVPTAIQLYDLQDRLGVSQPSKVVDWLLDATKQEIEKLPPLPMFPGSYPPEFSSYGNEGVGGGGAMNLYNFQIQNPYLHWDLQNLSLSHMGGGFQFQEHNNQHQIQSSVTNPQLYFCTTSAPTTVVPSFFSSDSDLRQQPMRQLLLNVNSRPLLNLDEETSPGDSMN